MDDLISRQAALNSPVTMVSEGLDWIPAYHIKELPTVQPEPTDIDAKEAVYNLAEKIGIHQLFALTVELRGEPIQPEPQWIPVEKELPEPRIDVWVNSDLGQMVGYYDEMVNLWYGRDYLELIVNAWMPLPEAYKPNNK